MFFNKTTMNLLNHSILSFSKKSYFSDCISWKKKKKKMQKDKNIPKLIW